MANGNASNFESFVAELSSYQHNFSVIGIDETNLDKCHKDLYKLPGYVSEYNDKLPGKINAVELLCISKKTLYTIGLMLTANVQQI